MASLSVARRRTLTHDQYTAAWISPLKVEHIAALAMLDEEHHPLSQSPRDQNVYTLGRIGNHNIVLAGLHRQGNIPAATVVSQMTMTFHNLRYGVLVGIGGGVPFGIGRAAIRLGHVVVGTPTGTDPGTIQYDYGKALEGGRFERTGSLAAPPATLLSAAETLQIRRETGDDDPVWKDIRRIRTDRPAMRHFAYPGAAKDHLYSADYLHQGPPKRPCNESGCDPYKRIPLPRSTMDDDNHDSSPAITVHWGTIASGGLVVKDAKMRDKLARKHAVLCFETEAVGVLEIFPCIVIRGISDYCDSHKNDEWHGFAAAAAAAYARQLFSYIPFAPSAGDTLQIPVEKQNRIRSMFRLPHWGSFSRLELPSRPLSDLLAHDEPPPSRDTKPPPPYREPPERNHSNAALDAKSEQLHDLWKLRKYNEAESLAREIVILREQAHGRNHVQTAKSQYNLALALYELRKYDESEVWLNKIVNKDVHMLILQGMALRMQRKYHRAEEVLKRALREPHSLTLNAHFELSRTYEAQGKYSDSEHVLRSLSANLMAKDGEDSERVASAKCNLGWALYKQRKYKEAEKVLRSALKAKGVQKNADTLNAQQLLGRVLLCLQRVAEAEGVFRMVADGRLASYGRRHGLTLQSFYYIGLTLQIQEKYRESEPFLRKAVDGQLEASGRMDNQTLDSLFVLGKTLWKLNKNREAETTMRKAAEGRLQAYGKDDLATIAAFHIRGMILKEQGDWGRAKKVLRIAADQLSHRLGSEHVETLKCTHALGEVLMEQNDLKEAERLFRRVVEVRTLKLGKGHDDTSQAIYMLGCVLMDQDSRSKEAEWLMRELLDIRKALAGRASNGPHKSDSSVRRKLAELYYHQDRLREAERDFKRVVDEWSRSRSKGPGHADTLEAQDFLARALYKQGKFGEASNAFKAIASERAKRLGKRHELTQQAMRQYRKAADHRIAHFLVS